jgi:hypothetical protein
MKNLAVFAVCVLVRLVASFFFVEQRRNRFHTISACTHHAAKIALHRNVP